MNSGHTTAPQWRGPPPSPVSIPTPTHQLGRASKYSPAEKSHLHVSPGQYLADTPDFGQIPFDVQDLLFCSDWVQFCIPVRV